MAVMEEYERTPDTIGCKQVRFKSRVAKKVEPFTTLTPSLECLDLRDMEQLSLRETTRDSSSYVHNYSTSIPWSTSGPAHPGSCIAQNEHSDDTEQWLVFEIPNFEEDIKTAKRNSKHRVCTDRLTTTEGEIIDCDLQAYLVLEGPIIKREKNTIL